MYMTDLIGGSQFTYLLRYYQCIQSVTKSCDKIKTIIDISFERITKIMKIIWKINIVSNILISQNIHKEIFLKS